MIKAAVVAMMLCGPFDPHTKLPKPPKHPIIKFLTKDLWKIRALAHPCWSKESAKLCADARSMDLNKFKVIITFTWRF